MTVNDLAIILVTETGNDRDDTDHVEQMEGYISDAYQDMSLLDWSFNFVSGSIDLVDGTRVYALPNTAIQIKSLRLDDGTSSFTQPIDEMNKEQLISMGVDLDQEEKPRVFYNEGYDSDTGEMQLGLWPVPTDSTWNALYTGVKMPTRLQSGNEIPFPDAGFIPALKHRVRMQVYADDGDMQGSALYEQRYEKSLSLLAGFLRKKPAQKLQASVSDLPSPSPSRSNFGPNYPSF